MGVPTRFNIRLAPGVRSTPSGAPEDPRGLRHSPRPSRRGGADRGAERGPNAESPIDLQPPPSASSRSPCWSTQPPHDVNDVAPAAIIHNLTRLPASPGSDPKVRTFDAFDADVTVDDGSR